MTKNISRRSVLKTGIATAVTAAGALTIPRKSEAATRLRMQTHWPTGVPWYKILYEGFANDIDVLTKGDLKITPLPFNTVVPTKDIFEAVGRGVLDMSFSWPGYWIGKLPVAGHLNGHAFTWENFEDMQTILYELGALDIIREAYAEHGIHVIGPIATGPTAIYSKNPIVTLEDFKGLKVRSSGTQALVLKKMGATPLFFPTSELYQSLQTGVCEAAHFGGAYGGSMMKLAEVTKYFVMPPLMTPTNAEILINKKKWDAMSVSQQTALERCCKASSAFNTGWSNAREIQAMADFRKGGGIINKLNDESMKMLRKSSIEVMDEYSKKDPKYSGKIADIIVGYLKKTDRI